MTVLDYYDYLVSVFPPHLNLLKNLSSEPALRNAVYKVYEKYLHCSGQFMEMFSARHAAAKRKSMFDASPRQIRMVLTRVFVST